MWDLRQWVLLLVLPCADTFLLPSCMFGASNAFALGTNQLRVPTHALSLAHNPALSGKRQQGRDGAAVLRASHDETNAVVLDRRTVLLAALFAGCKPALAYDFREEIVGQCTVQVPGTWKRIDAEGGVSFADPVSGAVMQRMSASAQAIATKGGGIKDLGKVENLDLVKTLGVRAELGKADMVGAARRGKGSRTSYDYDLAIAPKTCARDQEIVSGSCAYTEIVLLSAFVDGGQLRVLEVKASAEQWKKNGPALRRLRDSFASAPA